MLVWEFLATSAARTPLKTAVICDDRRVTYAELDRLSSAFAAVLLENGVKPSDRVAVLLENSIEAAIAIFGVLRAGCSFLIISQTIKKDKLEFILNDCGATAIAAQDVFLETVEEVRPLVNSLRLVLGCGGRRADSPRQESVVWFEEPPMWCSVDVPVTSIDTDVAALIYTSGSTGFPKGVTVSHLNVVSAANSITEYLENVSDDVIINALPLSFDYGLYQLLMSVKVGATLVLEKSFAYPFKLVQRIGEEKVTGLPGVPTIFAVLLKMRDLDPALFDGLRYVTNTAAALPPSSIKAMSALFRNARIYSMYGLTECKRVSYLPPEELERRPASVGKGMPNQRVDIVDDSGRSVPPGVVGELVVQGPNVMLGYWNRPEETREVIRTGRYPWERVLHTGDLFKRDEDGFLYFVARKDDIIKSRGEKVSPIEVERVIHELDEVQDVAVVSVPDPILGQAIKAVVVRAHGAELNERGVIRHCARRLENFMVPKVVEFRSSLPTTSTGKVSRRALGGDGKDAQEKTPNNSRRDHR